MYDPCMRLQLQFIIIIGTTTIDITTTNANVSIEVKRFTFLMFDIRPSTSPSLIGASAIQTTL